MKRTLAIVACIALLAAGAARAYVSGHPHAEAAGGIACVDASGRTIADFFGAPGL